jgi:ketosteroid isomerase-like protein
MRDFFFLLLSVFFFNNVSAQNAGPVISAERSFAAHALTHSTKSAFLQYMDSTAIVFARGNAVNAKRFWSRMPESPLKLIWEPAIAGMNTAADFGFTTGPYWMKNNLSDTAAVLAYGQYATVWKKNAAGEWKFLVDLGIELPAIPERAKQVHLISLKQKNKKRSAAPDSAIQLDIDFNNGLLAEGKNYWNKACTATTIFNLTGHYPMMGVDAIARFTESFPNNAKLIPAGGQFATDHQSAFTYGITELNGKKDGYFRFWQATDKGWKIVLQVITFGK